MNCEDVRVLLEGGRSAVQGAPEAKLHLDACANCREYAVQMQAEDELLAGALRAPADEKRFARVKAGVRRKIGNRGRRRIAPSTRQTRPSPVWPVWVLAAAGVLLALTAYLLLSPARPDRNGDRLAKEDPPPISPDPKTPPNPSQKPDSTAPVEPLTAQATPSTPATWALPKNVGELQSRLRNLHLLDDLNQVETVMRSLNDAEGLSIAEDAELYVDRIFALNPGDTELCREVLAGIRKAGMTERLAVLKERWRTPESERVLRTLETSDWAFGPALQPILAQIQSTGTDEATFAEAERVFQKRDYDRALGLYRSFAANRPKDRRVPMAEHASAFILQKKLKEPAEARKTYQRIAKDHAKEPIALSACFHIAETFEDDGRTDHALEQYGNFLDLAPKDPRANEANRRVEALRLKQKGEEAAPTWSQVLLQKKRKTPEEPKR